jgi:hypothetical protein
MASYKHGTVLIQVSTLTVFSGYTKALATGESDVQLASIVKPALATFDHFDVPWHNHLVQAGALSVLSNCLEKLLSEGKVWALVDNVCKLICMLLRCSDHQATQAIASSGGELLHLTVAALHMEHFIGESKVSSIYQLATRLSALEINLENLKASSRFLSLFREIFEDSTADGTDFLYCVIQLVQGELWGGQTISCHCRAHSW